MSGNYAEICYQENNGVDGDIFGGSWKQPKEECKCDSSVPGSSSSKKIPGTLYKELNAIDCRHISFRLVVAVEE